MVHSESSANLIKDIKRGRDPDGAKEREVRARYLRGDESTVRLILRLLKRFAGRCGLAISLSLPGPVSSAQASPPPILAEQLSTEQAHATPHAAGVSSIMRDGGNDPQVPIPSDGKALPAPPELQRYAKDLAGRTAQSYGLDADDLAQEVVLRFNLCVRDGNQIEHWRSFVQGIMRKTVAEWCRKRAPEQRFMQAAGGGRVAGNVCPRTGESNAELKPTNCHKAAGLLRAQLLNGPHQLVSSIDCLQADEDARRVKEMLASLPQRDHDALRLHLSGVSYEDIATQLGVSTTTAYERVLKVKKLLLRSVNFVEKSGGDAGCSSQK